MASYEELYGLVLEKKTKEEYRMSKFKKKYNYDPKRKTIEVDGETYKVDLDVKNPIINITDNEGNKVTSIRQLGIDGLSDDPTIFFDEGFFKIKNQKRRDSMLKHEIGHTKMLVLNPDSKKADKDFSDHISLRELLVSQNSELGEPLDKDDIDFIEDKIKSDPFYNQLISQKTSKKFTTEEREKIISLMRKYDKGSHANPTEFEADRYASNRTKGGSKTFKKGLRDYYHYMATDKGIKSQIKSGNKQSRIEYAKLGSDYRDDTPLDKETIKNIKKGQNKVADIDYNARRKALADKDIANSKIYKKESVDDIKLEIYEACYNGEISEEERDTLLFSISEKVDSDIESRLKKEFKYGSKYIDESWCKIKNKNVWSLTALSIGHLIDKGNFNKSLDQDLNESAFPVSYIEQIAYLGKTRLKHYLSLEEGNDGSTYNDKYFSDDYHYVDVLWEEDVCAILYCKETSEYFLYHPQYETEPTKLSESEIFTTANSALSDYKKLKKLYGHMNE